MRRRGPRAHLLGVVAAARGVAWGGVRQHGLAASPVQCGAPERGAAQGFSRRRGLAGLSSPRRSICPMGQDSKDPSRPSDPSIYNVNNDALRASAGHLGIRNFI